MTKLLLSIRSLDIGGAERQFIELVKHIDKSEFDVTVCTMYGGAQEEALRSIPGIKYHNLHKTGRYDLYRFYKKYSLFLKKKNPDVIYSFLGEMNLFSLWCKPKRTKIIWGFRASNIDLKQYGKISQALFWLQKKFSPFADKIIANSKASVTFHTGMGFDMRKSVVVPNGIDTDKFARNPAKRAAFKEKYHLGESDIAIGMVARIDPMKGYTVAAHAAKKILAAHGNITFFAIGTGDEKIKEACKKILGDLNDKRFFWLGHQNNVENFYSGFDLALSSSFGEGFSNSIAEAMSCGLPCVVTNVGDSALIVGDTGAIVQPNDPDDLVRGITELLKQDYKALGEQCRQRILENYSIAKMVKHTESEILQCVE